MPSQFCIICSRVFTIGSGNTISFFPVKSEYFEKIEKYFPEIFAKRHLDIYETFVKSETATICPTCHGRVYQLDRMSLEVEDLMTKIGGLRNEIGATLSQCQVFKKSVEVVAGSSDSSSVPVPIGTRVEADVDLKFERDPLELEEPMSEDHVMSDGSPEDHEDTLGQIKVEVKPSPKKLNKRPRGRPKKFPRMEEPPPKPKQAPRVDWCDLPRYSLEECFSSTSEEEDEAESEDEYRPSDKSISDSDVELPVSTEGQETVPKSVVVKKRTRKGKYYDDRRGKAGKKFRRGHLKCPICPKRFKNKPSFEAHVEDCRSRDGLLTCEICGNKVRGMSLHLMKHGIGNPDTKCVDCNICFPTMREYELHLVKKHPQSSAAQNVDRSKLEALINKANEKVACPYEGCDKMVSKDYLNQHIKKTHTKESKFICEICGLHLSVKRNMDVHMKKEHSGLPGEFLCDECPKSFYSNMHLLNHKKAQHQEKQFKCPTCSKAFMDKHRLERHKKLHSTNRPFICEHCGEAFAIKETLRLHIRNRHIQAKTPRSRRFPVKVVDDSGS